MDPVDLLQSHSASLSTAFYVQQVQQDSHSSVAFILYSIHTLAHLLACIVFGLRIYRKPCYDGGFGMSVYTWVSAVISLKNQTMMEIKGPLLWIAVVISVVRVGHWHCFTNWKSSY